MTNVYPLKCRIRNEDSGPTRIDVFDDIGEGGWFCEGLTAKDFAAQMAKVKGPLEVHINSGGGDVFDGIAIGNALRGHKGPVTTVVDGLAASIASVIAQSGQDRVVQPGSMMMIHDAMGSGYGVNAAEARDLADVLDKVSDNIASIYADRAGGTPASWRDTMKTETWYTAEEAVTAGLADRVGDGDAELPAGMDLAAFTAVPGRIAARLRELPTATRPQAAAADHGPLTTDGHTHAHPAFGAQGGDETHSHTHSHSNDSDHHHSHDTPQDRAARLRAAAAAEEHGHAGRDCWDPDSDGDCDLTAAGDTDHDYWSASGEQLKSVPGKPMGDALGEAHIRAIVRDELHVSNGDADNSPWDGPAAMSAASKADDPEAAFRQICAGEKTTGEPDTQDHWALPHHKQAGDPPNQHGVSAALGRLDETQDLKNKAAAEAHLKAHQSAMGGADDHAPDLSGLTPEQIRAALRGADA